MHVTDLPERTQDYLKELFDHEERNGVDLPLALGDLAAALNQKLPTASEAVKRLAAKELVVHERYRGVTLTELGRDLSRQVARRHRLLETFLVETLGYTWDEVHDEADVLEHACTDRFIARLDAHLNHPTRDPHGDPIPRADGSTDPLSARTLAEVTVGQKVIMEQVNDDDAELLRFLAAQNMRPGTEVELVQPPLAGLLHISVDGGEPFALAEVAAHEITVRSNTE
ncbi:metal-dependent transcriptional regulator [Corynebacterium stationis]|uniref:Diphtheria toxin repressor n=1 Tax=Corynebacterium stationis TaxID=1705 RepID=A0AB36CKB2_9CORY|nr:metal-dependent transcriptional regulator [Corynebacterium stationis]NME89165.1 metal-dependent transcriptional regulator [Corynebacterium stationis]WLP87497.1 metal-dependent transcriptional regulator [Corynebacterium stationis]HCM80166.1 metal-dependent transcriptional regulator [Corynebacterium stationis]